jgi:ribosomal protein L34E
LVLTCGVVDTDPGGRTSVAAERRRFDRACRQAGHLMGDAARTRPARAQNAAPNLALDVAADRPERHHRALTTRR